MSNDAAVPTVEDRELVNEALARAVAQMTLQWGRPATMPVTDDLMKIVRMHTPLIKPLIIEAEIAVATARVRERERCAKIADAIQAEARASGKVFDAKIEATAMTIAREIRSGE